MDETTTTRTQELQERLKRFALHLRRALPFVLGIAAAFIAMWAYQLVYPEPEPLSIASVKTAVVDVMASATPAPARSALVYQAIMPSIVYIRVQGGERGSADEMNGLGTGVVINTNGEILTSLHVVEGAEQINLTFADGTEALGQVIAAEPENDIAVLAASQLPELLVPAVLGNPNSLRVGDEAFVVGHPLGLYGSMSSGVISGFDRSFRKPDSDESLEGLIQIDAAVNPGNSGGPLLNRYGQVVGIVTGLVNPTEHDVFIGIGFAVPITAAGGAAGMPPY